jgi:nucleotide-binding universal stress UspA family protein
VVVAAHPGEAILHEAGMEANSLIAMASHGRGGVARMLLGSVAGKVIRAATVPVLVCRPGLTRAPVRTAEPAMAQELV